MSTEAKKVFISYSWKVQEKVIELAERLISNGIDVILDVYDLKEGQDKYAFMEQSVNDPSVDKVLIICDRSYMEKANDRSGGVGDETVIISPEIYGQMKQEKFIPIAFEVDEEGKACIPHYLKTRIYIDLTTEDDRYETEYEKLLRNIYQKPIHKKPALGTKPEWLEDETVDLSAIRDILKQVRGYTGGNTAKADFLLRKASDEFVDAAKQYVLPKDIDIADGLLKVIDQTKPFRDLFVTYCENLIYSDQLRGEILSELFARLYNELHDAGGKGAYSESDFELYDYMIWELFICATAVLLHYERFAELRQLLVRPYFLRSDYYNWNIEPKPFNKFRKYTRIIEEVCKPKSENPRLFTLAGDILVSREKKPILTRQSISNADLVLYQLSTVFDTSENKRWNVWFPTTYVYHEGQQALWKKLISKSYCKKIYPLFSVKTITELKEKIQGSMLDQTIRYNSSFDNAPGILSSIKLDEIGTLE